MRPTFNLLTEPWIPCIRLGQMQMRLESLRTVLAEAQEIEDVAVQSPLVAAALYRFLLAILHRSLRGPSDTRQWVLGWRRGQFDQVPLDLYLREVKDRFDLFDPVYPFYQGNMPAALKPKPALALSHQHTEFGANPQAFGRSLGASISPAHAALLLLAFHPYAIGGTVSRLPGESPSAPGGPLTKAAVVVVKGENLFQTLMLNLVKYGFSEADRPAWERGGAGSGPRPLDGHVDYLTLQTRRICLLPPERGDDKMMVQHVQIARGWDSPLDLVSWDQMVAFRQAKKRGEWFPLGLSVGRAAWRDLTSLLVASEQARPAQNLLWIAELARLGYLPNQPRTIEVLGMATHLFKILLWQRARLLLPQTCLDDPLLVEIGEALQLAEEAARVVRYQLGKVANSEADLGSYWAGLAEPFEAWLKCTGPEWSKVIQQHAWRSLRRGMSTSGVSLTEQTQSEARFGGTLHKLLAKEKEKEDG